MSAHKELVEEVACCCDCSLTEARAAISIIAERTKDARSPLEGIRDYPKKKDKRRTKDGYPLEMIYDEWAYKRMVNTYRDAAANALASLSAIWPNEKSK